MFFFCIKLLLSEMFVHFLIRIKYYVNDVVNYVVLNVMTNFIYFAKIATYLLKNILHI